MQWSMADISSGAIPANSGDWTFWIISSISGTSMERKESFGSILSESSRLGKPRTAGAQESRVQP